MVLDHPEIPLHTNGSENDIRCQVTKRHVSGGTHSDIGRDCRDAFSASPRPAGSSALPSGIILAPGSASAAVLSSRSFQISSAAADSPPDAAAARGFAPVAAHIPRLCENPNELLAKALDRDLLTV